ncbi:MAG: alpha-1,3-fucosyltransferase [Rhizobiaceae bacterium]|nr:alpha-1,3-fucosyltransferase [Rhizobiaceae bacterium]
MKPARRPLILFYTRFFQNPVDLGKLGAHSSVDWTNDKRRISEADAVVFHLPNQKEHGDAVKYPGQQWVAWSMESSENYPEMRTPAFMRRFDLRMTYETDADVWAPYLPPRSWWNAVRERPVVTKTSSAPVVMFQSSNINRSGREWFAADLADHIDLDSYGRFLKNKTLRGPDRGTETKIETIGNYPFCIAFENSVCDDYVTEKLYDPLRASSVPIYLGASNAKKFAPAGSFIDASDFRDGRELAGYLKHLLGAPAEYQAYHEWRRRPFDAQFESFLDVLETDAMDRLAELVGRRASERTDALSGLPSLPFGTTRFLRTRLWRLRMRLKSLPN